MEGFAKRFVSALGVSIIALTAACGGTDGQTDTETTGRTQQNLATGIKFDNFEVPDVSGVFVMQDGKRLEFTSSWKKQSKSVEIVYANTTVGRMDYNSRNDGLFTAEANLTAEAKSALDVFIEELKTLDQAKVAKTFGDGEAVDQTALGLLFNYVTHFATAPLNTPQHYDKYHFEGSSGGEISPMSLGGDGIQYLWQCKRSAAYSSRYAWAYWDDSRGAHAAYLACGLTAPSCEGRCGAGCPCNSWYCLNRFYTQDCFEHDWCLNYNPGDGTTDPLAPNCGDEWGDASDDFLFGSSSGW